MSSIKLRGMTWDHPRGYDPLAASSAEWQRKTGVEITWDRRSLQDFESYPVEELAKCYDLIIIDHPHVGQITEEHCLQPLDVPGRETALAEIAAGSVGASHPSYFWQGHQWAFAVDAATQIQSWVPSRIDAPVRDWQQLLQLAREGRVHCPMRPPHSLMCVYTLAAHLGCPAQVTSAQLFSDDDATRQAIELLRELSSNLPSSCWEQDPIAVYEQAALADSRIACIPLIYGYVSYALEGFRPTRLAFADIPTVDGRAPSGSALGGTGLAVSAYSQAKEAALDFTYWVASGAVQRDIYGLNGGQPGHDAAWTDDAVNTPVLDFYKATRATLDGAFVRPRHNGYMPFQHEASLAVNAALQNGTSASALIAQLNDLFRQCLPKV